MKLSGDYVGINVESLLDPLQFEVDSRSKFCDCLTIGQPSWLGQLGHLIHVFEDLIGLTLSLCRLKGLQCRPQCVTASG